MTILETSYTHTGTLDSYHALTILVSITGFDNDDYHDMVCML